ncbi:hypothetical protein [Carnobacterium maltaromaticum]|uniref:hypothetical protein n=1 Tax=Carnobacterium maltaromaticum TaxID=2751 RepID=UPI0004971BCE|nr:hypothetical protein [Carnobacterium maltaromaticum]
MKAKVVNNLFKKLESQTKNLECSDRAMWIRSGYLKAIQDLVEFYAEEEQKKTNKDCNPS